MVAVQATTVPSGRIDSYADKPDYAAYFPNILVDLKGQPNWKLSNKDTEWRYGSHGSFSADLINGRWYDHEGKVGGGVLDFIARELKCDLPAAGKWFEQKHKSDALSRQLAVTREPAGADAFQSHRDPALIKRAPPPAGGTNGHRHEAHPPHHEAPKATAWEPKHVVARYDYRDEASELLFQVLRIEEGSVT